MECEITWLDIEEQAHSIAGRWQGKVRGVYGVPRGGVPAAVYVAGLLDLPVLGSPTELERSKVLVVDDLVDSGATAKRYRGGPFDALFRKSTSPERYAPQAALRDGWLTFPWEQQETGPEDAVVRLLQWIGEDPKREGLVDTPKRVAKAWREMTSGYAEDAHAVLGTTFDVPCDELVAVTGIEFVSLCEHHVLPFIGTASIGYLPGARVVGLSKLGRVVDVFARRLQVQERLTQEIAQAISDVLQPLGVAVVLRASHSCMSCRGVRKQSQMITSAMHGRFRESAELRSEFLALERSSHA